MSTTPRLTIIVISRDSPPRLAATLTSVWEQKEIEAEIIVIDGGAAAENGAALESVRPRIAAMINSTPAESTTAALNRAIAAVTGEWILVLQSGDRVVGERVLSEALNWLRRTEAGVAAGEVAYDTGEIEKLRSHVNPVRGEFLPASATFYRRTVFAENGDFEINLAYMARYEFHVRLWKHRIRFKPIPLRLIAAARSPSFPWAARREESRVRHRYFSAGRCLAWDAWSTVRWLGARLLRRDRDFDADKERPKKT